MSRLRLCLASLLFASTVSTGCTSTAVTTPAHPGHHQTQLDRAALRAKLAARRQQSFDRFLAYREGRVYPINSTPTPAPGFRHVWMDELGNLCAAATIISGDWGRDATARVGEDNVELRIADVTSGPVADWILTSGLTHHELVAIQAPMVYVPSEDGREQEIARLYSLYTDVERQLRAMWDESLDDAVDALMARPDLARELLRDKVAGPETLGS